MGRMHAPGKGISQSALPYRRTVPNWLKLPPEEVKEQIYKLAKKGLPPSQIGRSLLLVDIQTSTVLCSSAIVTIIWQYSMPMCYALATVQV